MNTPLSGQPVGMACERFPVPTPPAPLSCRPACAACCIAPSISTPMPGHPQGKPAGVPCANLTADLRCGLWGSAQRPACCGGLQASHEMCADSAERAMAWLVALDEATRP